MRTRPAAGTPAARSCCTMLFRLAANSASGTCCLGFSSAGRDEDTSAQGRGVVCDASSLHTHGARAPLTALSSTRGQKGGVKRTDAKGAGSGPCTHASLFPARVAGSLFRLNSYRSKTGRRRETGQGLGWHRH